MNKKALLPLIGLFLLVTGIPYLMAKEYGDYKYRQKTP